MLGLAWPSWSAAARLDSTNTPRTTQIVYYSTAANTTYPECGGHAEWANLVCRNQAGGSPSAGAPIPVRTTTYGLYNQPEVTTERTPSGTLIRTTTATYDSAGRPLTTSVTASTGTALPTTKYVYESATGLLSQTQSLSGTTVTAQIARIYDTLGRATSYTDADGNVSTTTYDLLSRPATVGDGKGTQTLSYDDGSERRGLLTKVVDSQAGTFTAAYDADGDLTSEGLPNGLTVVTGYDETGTAVTQSTSTAGCTPDSECIDLDEQATINAHGQWATHSTDLSGQQYAYDKAGRLTTALDYAEPISGYSGCTTRTYGFDAASNRTSYNSYAPADGGDCQTTTVTVSKTSTYDTADRAINTGYTYDPLGRTTTVPSADTQNGAGDLTATYDVNDLVRTLTQGGTTTTYTLDVDQSRVRSWTDSTTTSTDHYDSDTDSPAWTAIGTAYTRNIAGPDGGLAATYDSSSGNVRIQITDLHGDVLGIAASNLTTNPGILATFETDEYGVPRDPGDIGDVRYGYLGEHQRAADNLAGITLMGVRLYNPATGRFLSVDPVYGGNPNAYVYPTDPLSGLDLDGRDAGVIVAGAGAVAGAAVSLPADVVALILAGVVLTAICLVGGCSHAYALVQRAARPNAASAKARNDKRRYILYEIYYGIHVWKYGISAVIPKAQNGFPRPEGQLKDCEKQMRVPKCGYTILRKYIRGYLNARIEEYTLINAYVMRYGHCPPGHKGPYCK